MHYITFIILFLLILIIILIIHQYIQDKKILETVTNKYRGTSTERLMVLKLLKSGISNKVIFHDLYLKKSGNQFCQIDIVVATKVGIVVFEIKKYNGWIFGLANQSQWTQLLAYGREKYRFYNPILQNSKHIQDLKNQLPQFEDIPFYSVIVFFGNCTL